MNKTVAIIIGILLVIAFVGLGIYFLLESSQPPSPPPATPPAAEALPPPPTQDPVVPAPPQEPAPPTVPTEGGVVSGVITNISGGPNNPAGIGREQGTQGRCTNNGDATSFCTPRAGERAVVIACPTRTGIRCDGRDGGNVVADDITRTVAFTEFINTGCTIQIDIFVEGESIADNEAALRDFIIFQKDNCDPAPPQQQPPTQPQPEIQNSQCGETCVEDSDCIADNNVCSSDGVCVLETCQQNPDVCEADLCTVSTPEEVNQCGDSCTTDAQCPSDHSCSADGQCTADSCIDAEGDVIESTTCVDGCVVEPEARCGDDCADNSQCPTDHTCADGKCIADFCLPDNCEDGCTLPATNLVNDEVDRILVGMLLLIIGIVAIRTNYHTEIFYLLGGRNVIAGFSERERELLEQEKVIRARQEKKELVENSKKLRNNFEDKILKE